MRHLLLGDCEQFSIVGALRSTRIRGGFRPGSLAADKYKDDRRSGSECSHPPTAIRTNIHASFLMASSSYLPLPSIAPAQSYKMPTPADRPAVPIGSCARRPDNPRDW